MTLVICHPLLTRSRAYARLGNKVEGRAQTVSRQERLGGGEAFDFKEQMVD